jgi:hypothetical protein
MTEIQTNKLANILPLPWCVHLGWEKGHLHREEIYRWCRENLVDRRDIEWSYEPGGSWYFAHEEDAVAFQLVWD